jgi:hypothetical protein
MWLVIGAAAAWALPVGIGVSGLVDFSGGAPGGNQARYPADFGAPLAGEKVGCADVLTDGCTDPAADASLGPTFGLVVPLYFSLASNAALRVEARGSYSQGRVRAVCDQDGGGTCSFKAKGLEFPFEPGEFGSAEVFLPSLTVSAGPDVRLTTGDGIAPHLSALLGGGLVGPFLNSDWFTETRTPAFTAVASAAIGVTTQPGSPGWFVDLGYSSQIVSGSKVAADGDLRLQPFLVNGVRLDAGLLFGASN